VAWSLVVIEWLSQIHGLGLPTFRLFFLVNGDAYVSKWLVKAISTAASLSGTAGDVLRVGTVEV
jgi:hypothetical protein